MARDLVTVRGTRTLAIGAIASAIVSGTIRVKVETQQNPSGHTRSERADADADGHPRRTARVWDPRLLAPHATPDTERVLVSVVAVASALGAAAVRAHP